MHLRSLKTNSSLRVLIRYTMSNNKTLSESPLEANVGISVFANSANGFQGIHKQRYSDFVVREVDRNGSISCLVDTNGSQLESTVFGKKASEMQGESPTDVIECVVEKLISLTLPLRDTYWLDSRAEFTKFLFECVVKSEDCKKELVAFPCTEKIVRTKVHEIVRNYLGEFVESDTAVNDSVQYIRLISKHMLGNKNKRNRMQWPQGVGNYLKFTLFKENVDTMSACNILSRHLNLKSGGIDYAGTKDKRAVTAQSCTVYRRRPSDLAKINRYNHNPLIRVGDFSYTDQPIGLGSLGGNNFSIVLRALNAPKEIVATACEALQSSGFINYFGLQRFGKGGAGSHEIGRAVFKAEWKAAIELMFVDREGDRDEVVAAKQAFKDKSYKQARNYLPQQMYAEKCVLDALALHPNDYSAAHNRIPKNTRLICLHAYQSYIWNMAASERVRMYGLTCVEGDLIALNPAAVLEVDDALAAAEGDAEGESSEPVDLPATSAALDSAATHDDFQRSKNLDYSGIRAVTAEDIAAGTFSIRDIILPLPGTSIMLPQNAIGKFYSDILESDGLSLAAFGTCAPQYRTRGAYRRLLQMPTDFEWAIIDYTNPHAELVETELTTLRPAGGHSFSHGPSSKASSSSTSALHLTGGQSDDYSSSPSTSAVNLTVSSLPSKPLRSLVSPIAGVESSPAAGIGAEAEAEAEAEAVTTSMDDSAALQGVVLRFTLPPGTYATMLLRELTKESTETIFQAQLTAASCARAERDGASRVTGPTLGGVVQQALDSVEGDSAAAMKESAEESIVGADGVNSQGRDADEEIAAKRVKTEA